jgi:protein-tyrosine-phosphatase
MKSMYSVVLVFFLFLLPSFKPFESQKIYKKLAKYTETLPDEFDQISEERKATLEELGEYIYKKRVERKSPNILVICTHNSRLSHFGQLLIKTASVYYGIEEVSTFSGGTEATAFNPRAVEALDRAGFRIMNSGGGDGNPRYLASIGSDYSDLLMYSKRFDDRQNSQSEFCAVMVCSEADKSCPYVPGADERLSIPYEDPKHYDDTPAETEKYDERCRQIAREMFYAMNHAKSLLVKELESRK